MSPCKRTFEVAAELSFEEGAQLNEVMTDEKCHYCKGEINQGDFMYLGMCIDCYSKPENMHGIEP